MRRASITPSDLQGLQPPAPSARASKRASSTKSSNAEFWDTMSSSNGAAPGTRLPAQSAAPASTAPCRPKRSAALKPGKLVPADPALASSQQTRTAANKRAPTQPTAGAKRPRQVSAPPAPAHTLPAASTPATVPDAVPGDAAAPAAVSAATATYEVSAPSPASPAQPTADARPAAPTPVRAPEPSGKLDTVQTPLGTALQEPTWLLELQDLCKLPVQLSQADHTAWASIALSMVKAQTVTGALFAHAVACMCSTAGLASAGAAPISWDAVQLALYALVQVERAVHADHGLSAEEIAHQISDGGRRSVRFATFNYANVGGTPNDVGLELAMSPFQEAAAEAASNSGAESEDETRAALAELAERLGASAQPASAQDASEYTSSVRACCPAVPGQDERVPVSMLMSPQQARTAHLLQDAAHTLRATAGVGASALLNRSLVEPPVETMIRQLVAALRAAPAAAALCAEHARVARAVAGVALSLYRASSLADITECVTAWRALLPTDSPAALALANVVDMIQAWPASVSVHTAEQAGPVQATAVVRALLPRCIAQPADAPLRARLGDAVSCAIRFQLRRALNPHVLDVGDSTALRAMVGVSDALPGRPVPHAEVGAGEFAVLAGGGGVGRGGGGGDGMHLVMACVDEAGLSYNMDDTAAIVHRALLHVGNLRAPVSAALPAGWLPDRLEDAVAVDYDHVHAVVHDLPVPVLADVQQFAAGHAFLRELLCERLLNAANSTGDAWQRLKWYGSLVSEFQLDAEAYLGSLADLSALNARLEAEAVLVDEMLGAANAQLTALWRKLSLGLRKKPRASKAGRSTAGFGKHSGISDAIAELAAFAPLLDPTCRIRYPTLEWELEESGIDVDALFAAEEEAEDSGPGGLAGAGDDDAHHDLTDDAGERLLDEMFGGSSGPSRSKNAGEEWQPGQQQAEPAHTAGAGDALAGLMDTGLTDDCMCSTEADGNNVFWTGR